MNISEAVALRQISEFLHFTTNSGVAGILASAALKARARLTVDAYLEHIYTPNCPNRDRDRHWHDYVNLSISNITTHLFSITENKWHAGGDGWWCVLSFDPVIATHPGVYFTTTNNMYTGVARAQGIQGFEAMFAPRIIRWAGSVVTRASELALRHPTCEQAEVLYPIQVPLSHLQCIYTREQRHCSAIQAMCGALQIAPVTCIVAPDKFETSR